jgi:hypothetical protein
MKELKELILIIFGAAIAAWFCGFMIIVGSWHGALFVIHYLSEILK